MARAQSRSVTLDGVYVQKMAPDGDELLLSAFRDPNFGVDGLDRRGRRHDRAH